jgi:hypothetical protein
LSAKVTDEFERTTVIDKIFIRMQNERPVPILPKLKTP